MLLSNILRCRRTTSVHHPRMQTTPVARKEDELAKNFRKMPTMEAWKAFTDYSQQTTPSPQLYTTALDTLSRIGQYHRAISLWNEMKSKKVNSPVEAHNTMMSVYSRTGEDEKVISLFSELAH